MSKHVLLPLVMVDNINVKCEGTGLILILTSAWGRTYWWANLLFKMSSNSGGLGRLEGPTNLHSW